MSRYEVTNEQWNRIESLLPQQHTGKGRPAKDNRTMLNGMMWIARSGAQRRELSYPKSMVIGKLYIPNFVNGMTRVY